jgi:hypothetical protein
MNQNGIFALFKGDSGAGKSVGALSFPDPIVLDHDRKMPAIKDKHFPGKSVPYKQFTDCLQVGQLLEDWKSAGCPFETIIADSLTTLSYNVLKTVDDLKGSTIMDKLKEFQKMGTKAHGKSLEVRGFDYYNVEDNFLKFYIDSLKELWMRPGKPYHVILIAHVMSSETTDIRTKEITRMRRIVTAGSKIAAYIPAQFDETWHFYTSHGDLLADTGAVKHLVTTEAIGEDYAKTAYRLPNKIDFTDASLYEKIEGELNSQPSSQQPQTESTSHSTKPAKFKL